MEKLNLFITIYLFAEFAFYLIYLLKIAKPKQKQYIDRLEKLRAEIHKFPKDHPTLLRAGQLLSVKTLSLWLTTARTQPAVQTHKALLTKVVTSSDHWQGPSLIIHVLSILFYKFSLNITITNHQSKLVNVHRTNPIIIWLITTPIANI